MGKGYKAARLSEEIKKIISSMLIVDIKDPVLRRNMISITGVSVTSDGSYATCYVSVIGKNLEEAIDAEEKEEILKALERAKGIMRREVGNKVKMRHVPELIFKFDESLEYGRHMEKILDELKKDKEE